MSKILKKDFIKCGDCISLMQEIPSESVDIVFADPPYNLSLSGKELLRPNNTKVNGVNDDWDKFSSFEEYDNFTANWAKEVKRILKPNGTFWVIGTYHNIFRIGKILQDLGFWILNDIIWCKNNPMPNFRGTRFANAHETLIWCSKSKDSKYKFNYNIAKNLNDQEIQMRSDWLIPICRGKERIYDSSGQISHSTQKPEALLKRIILTSTDKGDLVLDPFLGSGTTAVVSKMLGRHFIGFDQDENYIKVAQDRIDNAELLDNHLLPMDDYIKSLKVKFALLVEINLIKSGDFLFDKKGNRAQIRADGMLVMDEIVDTIHGMASRIVGKRTNGWIYWLISSEGRELSIDELRCKFRKDYLL